MTSLPLPGRQNAGHARRDTSFLLGVYEIYRYDITTPPGRQNAGDARRDTSFLLVVYEIYRYDVTTSSWSTECRQCQTRYIFPARGLRNLSL